MPSEPAATCSPNVYVDVSKCNQVYVLWIPNTGRDTGLSDVPLFSVCVCVCVCSTCYILSTKTTFCEQSQVMIGKVRTFWLVFPTSTDCLRVKT